jgi:hypothetical protein
VADLVREVLRNPRDHTSAKGQAAAIAGIEADNLQPEDEGPRPSGLQTFKHDRDDSSQKSTASRRAEIARKKAEMLGIAEQRAKAEIEALEAEEEAASRHSGESVEQLSHRLAMIGLGSEKREGNREMSAPRGTDTPTGAAPRGTNTPTGAALCGTNPPTSATVYHQGAPRGTDPPAGAQNNLQDTVGHKLPQSQQKEVSKGSRMTTSPLPDFGRRSEEQVPLCGPQPLLRSAFNAVRGIAAGYVNRGAASEIGMLGSRGENSPRATSVPPAGFGYSSQTSTTPFTTFPMSATLPDVKDSQNQRGIAKAAHVVGSLPLSSSPMLTHPPPGIAGSYGPVGSWTPCPTSAENVNLRNVVSPPGLTHPMSRVSRNEQDGILPQQHANERIYEGTLPMHERSHSSGRLPGGGGDVPVGGASSSTANIHGNANQIGTAAAAAPKSAPKSAVQQFEVPQLLVDSFATAQAEMLQRLEEATARATTAADEASKAAARAKEEFHSIDGSEGRGKALRSQPPKPATLTVENLREHRRAMGSRDGEPAQEAQANQRYEDAEGIDAEAATNNLPTGQWQVLQSTEAGVTRLELKEYDGLAIGDIIEIDAGTAAAEVVTVIKFGSILISAPTRFSHRAGASVRRLIEGSGQRYVRPASGANATGTSRPLSSLGTGGVDEGFEDRSSWSPREREHQLARYRRKMRGKRQADLKLVRQPILVVSVRQPDKITLTNWPSFPQMQGWIQSTTQAWRVLTSGGDHAEAYLGRAMEVAKVRTDDEFAARLEELRCDVNEYIAAEEKLALELLQKFPDAIQQELAVVREKRRRDSLPALVGRQLLAWGLRRFCRDGVRDRNTARNAMQSLRDAVKKSPPGRAQYRRLFQAIQVNLNKESAEDMGEEEIWTTSKDFWTFALSSRTRWNSTERSPSLSDRIISSWLECRRLWTWMRRLCRGSSRKRRLRASWALQKALLDSKSTAVGLNRLLA